VDPLGTGNAAHPDLQPGVNGLADLEKEILDAVGDGHPLFRGDDGGEEPVVLPAVADDPRRLGQRQAGDRLEVDPLRRRRPSGVEEPTVGGDHHRGPVAPPRGGEEVEEEIDRVHVDGAMPALSMPPTEGENCRTAWRTFTVETRRGGGAASGDQRTPTSATWSLWEAFTAAILPEGFRGGAPRGAATASRQIRTSRGAGRTSAARSRRAPPSGAYRWARRLRRAR